MALSSTRFLTLVLALFLSFPSVHAQSPIENRRLSNNDTDYQLLLSEGNPRILVMLLHGLGGDADFFNTSEFTQQLDPYRAQGYVFFIPQGRDSKPLGMPPGKPYRAWNGGDPAHRSVNDCCFGLFTQFENFNRHRDGQALFDAPSAPDDIEPLRIKLLELQKRFGISDEKTALLGISNGAIMAYRLQCSLRHRLFQSIVAIQGSLTGYADCGSGTTENLLHIHGGADKVVPFAGGKTWIAPLYPEFHFQRSPLQSFEVLAKAANCRFGSKAENAKSVAGKAKSFVDAPETEWMRYEARCAEKSRRYHFIVYRGAGHEYRMSMFRLGMKFIAQNVDSSEPIPQ